MRVPWVRFVLGRILAAPLSLPTGKLFPESRQTRSRRCLLRQERSETTAPLRQALVAASTWKWSRSQATSDTLTSTFTLVRRLVHSNSGMAQFKASVELQAISNREVERIMKRYQNIPW